MTPHSFGALTIAHQFVTSHVKEGDFCIDATAGKGGDTALLCRLVGTQGKVVAIDIQQQAVDCTRKRLEEEGLSVRAKIILDSHINIHHYAKKESVKCIMFNLGWLPGGDHSIFTQAKSSIEAIGKGLELLTPNGIMSVCIYYGKDTGFEEKERVLEYLKGIDAKRFTVIVCDFVNRPNCPPIPVLITKEL